MIRIIAKSAESGEIAVMTSVGEKEFVVLVAFLMSIVALSIDALLPALGIIASDLHVAQPNHAQYLISLIFIGMTVGQLIAGPCSDAFGRKKILYFGIFFFMVGSFVSYLADSFPIVLVGRLIQGLGVSGPYVSAVSIVRDRFSGRNMAKVMSLVMMIFITVPAIAPTVGQTILLFASWREVFLLYIAYSFIIGTWIYMRLDETLPVERRVPFSIRTIKSGFVEVAGSKVAMSYTACMGICFGSFVGYLNSSQQIFQNQFGVGKLFAAYFGLLALILGVASLLNSRFVERLGMHYVCVRSFATIAVASVLFLLLHLVTHIELWMFLVYAAVLFFSFGLVFGNLNALAMEPMGHIAGIASAIIGAVSSAISMTIGITIGQLYNNNLVPITSGFFVFGTGSLLLVLYAHRVKEGVNPVEAAGD